MTTIELDKLFEGQIKGEQYSTESLQNILKQALTKANISKPVSLHGGLKIIRQRIILASLN